MTLSQNLWVEVVSCARVDCDKQEWTVHVQILPNAVIDEKDIPQAIENEKNSHLYHVRPVVRGEIRDFEGLESMIRHVLYHECKWCQGGEENVVLVEPILTPRLDREKLTQIMFERFNLNSYFVTDSAVASLFSIGKTGGIVVDLGYEKIDVAPVIEGMVQPSAAARIPVGGKHVTDALLNILREGGRQMSCADVEAMKVSVCDRIRAQKAKAARDAANEQDNQNNSENKSDKKSIEDLIRSQYVYKLPDGQEIDIKGEMESVREYILGPHGFGLDLPSLSDVVISAGMVTTVHGERESRKSLIENIYVCGGGSGIPGLAEELLGRIRQKSHASLTPGICTPAEYLPEHIQQYASWFGAAALGNFIHFNTALNQMQHAVTKAEYNEYGPMAIHRRCN